MCFSEFLSLFYPKSRDLENDYQTNILDNELLETHHKGSNCPKEIPLKNSNAEK